MPIVSGLHVAIKPDIIGTGGLILVVGVPIVATAFFFSFGPRWAAVAVLAVLGPLALSIPPSSRRR